MCTFNYKMLQAVKLEVALTVLLLFCLSNGLSVFGIFPMIFVLFIFEITKKKDAIVSNVWAHMNMMLYVIVIPINAWLLLLLLFDLHKTKN